MAITSQLTVWCDVPDCPEWTYVQARTWPEARKEAEARHGWRVTTRGRGRVLDVCPGHLKDMGIKRRPRPDWKDSQFPDAVAIPIEELKHKTT